MPEPEKEAEKTPCGDIARSIADGEPIDWSHLKGETGLSERAAAAFRTLEAMRLVQSRWRELEEPPAMSQDLALFKDLEIFEEMGRGIHSRVYRARDKRSGRELALKILRSSEVLTASERKEFVGDLEILASLKHPGIVRIHSIEVHDAHIGLYLDPVPGRNLARAIEHDGPFSIKRSLGIARDLCRALGAIHAKGLAHRDLEPDNVMITGDGGTVLLDFGPAHTIGPADLKSVQGEKGTSLLMSPEQYQPEQDAPGSKPGVETDVYAMGVLLCWMASGMHPFEARSFYELRDRVLAGEAAPLEERRPDIPRAYAQVARRAMALRPRDRYASAEKLGGDLARIAVGIPPRLGRSKLGWFFRRLLGRLSPRRRPRV